MSPATDPELPIRYLDGGLLFLGWSVDPARAKSVVDDRAFEPWLLAGRAWAVLCAFEYRETTIGPYGELGIGVLAKRKGTKPSALGYARNMRSQEDVGLWVVNLPVTSERARKAGVELWGYPKYVRDMDMHFGDDGVRFGLAGELEITAGPGSLSTSCIPFVTWSITGEGALRRTIIEADCRVKWGGARKARVKVVGDGPSAKTVKALGLEKPPLVAFQTNAFRSVLPIGDDMGVVAGFVKAAKQAEATP
jgi:hypothetical protein